MRRPRLLLDTNVCEKLRDATFQFDVERMRGRIRHEFDIVVSPQTFIEILKSVKDARTEEHFEIRRKRLNVMTNDGEAEFVRFPGSFALSTVLGLETPLKEHGPAEFRQWYRILVTSNSLAELVECNVQLPDDPRRYGLDLPFVEHEEKDGVRRHREFLTAIASGSYQFPPPAIWAQRIADHLECSVTNEQRETLAKRLSAAYEYHKATFKLMTNNPNYNVEGHDSDRMDHLQLFYLCDPELYILTDDAGIRSGCSASSQACRILALTEF
jgi:hypothetical protein